MNLEPLQVGRLLDTEENRKLTNEQKEACSKIEESIAFMKCSVEASGGSRLLTMTFPSPEECKAFVGNYNSLLDTIDLLQYENYELKDELRMHGD